MIIIIKIKTQLIKNKILIKLTRKSKKNMTKMIKKMIILNKLNFYLG
jgi:hypothetical protein